jgi:spore coat protein CotH
VFNPDQLLDYELTLPAADWEALLADDSYSLYFQAELRCGADPPLTVGVQKKRSAGAQKVGLKIDVNHVVDAQTFHGLKKLSFENGRSSGGDVDDGTVRDVLAEYFAWRMMQRGGALASRAAFARVGINGGSPMVYANVERIDKVFLADRLGEDEGWLYKKSGGEGDGLKTHESDGLTNPHEAAFCFWIRGGGCAAPSDETLKDTLPGMLDIQGMLRFGAINALIANTDGLLFKDNNYYYYDRVQGGRVYFPWDLDTALSGDVDVLAGGVPGGTTQFTDVLFSNWRDDYVALLRTAVETDLTQAVADAELARALSVAGAALDEDPYASGTTDEAAAALSAFWTNRLATVTTALETP